MCVFIYAYTVGPFQIFFSSALPDYVACVHECFLGFATTLLWGWFSTILTS